MDCFKAFLSGPSSGCSADPLVAHLVRKICIYVHIVHSCSHVLPLGGLFPRTELLPPISFLYLRAGLFKKRGALLVCGFCNHGASAVTITRCF